MHGPHFHACHRRYAGRVGCKAPVRLAGIVLLRAPACGVPASYPGCVKAPSHRPGAPQYDGALKRHAYGKHYGDPCG